MPDVTGAVKSVAEFGKGLLKWFSADERRKRFKLGLDVKVKKAIQREEEHYERLDVFLTWIEGHLDFESSRDLKAFDRDVKEFKEDKRVFLRLT